MALKPDTNTFSQFLRLAFLRSPNYVAGQSGWTINQDGSVEFNNGTFRGSIVGGSLFIYSGTPGVGNLVESATNLTADPFGNKTIPGGDAVYSNTRALLFSSTSIQGYTGSLAAGWTALSGAIFQLDTVTHGGSAGFDFLGYLNVAGGLILDEIGTLSAVAGGPFAFGSTVTGALQFLADSTKGDSDTYDTGRKTLVNAANVPLSNAAFTSIFTNKPVAAIPYRITADLLVSIGGTASDLIVKLTGPAVGALTNVQWRVTFEAGTGESVFAGHSIGNLNSFTAPSTTFSANSVVHVWMSAYVTFTAAGNLNLQAELGTASAGSQVSLGSTMDVRPVG